MQRRPWHGLLLLSLLLSGCLATMSVQTKDGDPALIGARRSFAVAVLAPERGAPELERKLTKRVGPEVAQQVAQRGYRPAQVPYAQVLLFVDVATAGFSTLQTYAGSYNAIGMRTNVVEQNRQSTVVSLDVVDPSTKVVLWRAVAQARGGRDLGDGELRDLISMLVGQLPLVGTPKPADRLSAR